LKKTPDDAVKAISAIVDAVALGELTPMEAETLSRMVEHFAKAIEVSDLAKRISALEETGVGK
jgi:DNA replication protein DnaD